MKSRETTSLKNVLELYDEYIAMIKGESSRVERRVGHSIDVE